MRIEEQGKEGQREVCGQSERRSRGEGTVGGGGKCTTKWH